MNKINNNYIYNWDMSALKKISPQVADVKMYKRSEIWADLYKKKKNLNLIKKKISISVDAVESGVLDTRTASKFQGCEKKSNFKKLRRILSF